MNGQLSNVFPNLKIEYFIYFYFTLLNMDPTKVLFINTFYRTENGLIILNPEYEGNAMIDYYDKMNNFILKPLYGTHAFCGEQHKNLFKFYFIYGRKYGYYLNRPWINKYINKLEKIYSIKIPSPSFEETSKSLFIKTFALNYHGDVVSNPKTRGYSAISYYNKMSNIIKSEDSPEIKIIIPLFKYHFPNKIDKWGGLTIKYIKNYIKNLEKIYSISVLLPLVHDERILNRYPYSKR